MGILLEQHTAGVAFIDGAYHPISEARIPLLDWGFLRSDANQDTVSVWQGLFFRLEDHLDRFENNVAKLKMNCPYKRDEIRAIANECVWRTGLENAYFQMIMTRGVPAPGSRDPRNCDNRFYAFCIPYVWIATPEQQDKGLHLTVSSICRIPHESVDPTLKHYHWLDFEMGLLEAFDRGGDTVVLVDRNGHITEGPGFNLFFVKDGKVTTPDSGVLNGMTRRTILELCAEVDVRCEPDSILAAQLGNGDEVFLSSTAGGVIPVTTVDNKVVGDGIPGPVTQQLRTLYWEKRELGWHGTPVRAPIEQMLS